MRLLVVGKLSKSKGNNPNGNEGRNQYSLICEEKLAKLSKIKEKYGQVREVRKSKENYHKCACSTGSRQPVWQGIIRKIRLGK